jgi:hypothetical protein
MRRAVSHPSPNTLNRVIDLMVEHTIRLDALNDVLKEINPLLHERYVGAIESLQSEKTAELRRAIAARFKPESEG